MCVGVCWCVCVLGCVGVCVLCVVVCCCVLGCVCWCVLVCVAGPPLHRTPFRWTRRTPPPPDRPKFRAFFFPSPTPIFILFFSLRVSSRVFFPLSGGLLVEFWWCFGQSGPQMCLFSPSGCPVEDPSNWPNSWPKWNGPKSSVSSGHIVRPSRCAVNQKHPRRLHILDHGNARQQCVMMCAEHLQLRPHKP